MNLINKKYVSEIKKNYIIKKLAQGVWYSLLFTRLPILVIIYTLFSILYKYNFFLSKERDFFVFKSLKIMSGKILDYKKYLKLYFGQYC